MFLVEAWKPAEGTEEGLSSPSASPWAQSPDRRLREVFPGRAQACRRKPASVLPTHRAPSRAAAGASCQYGLSCTMLSASLGLPSGWATGTSGTAAPPAAGAGSSLHPPDAGKTPLSPRLTTRKVSRHGQMSSGRDHCPQLGHTGPLLCGFTAQPRHCGGRWPSPPVLTDHRPRAVRESAGPAGPCTCTTAHLAPPPSFPFIFVMGLSLFVRLLVSQTSPWVVHTGKNVAQPPSSSIRARASPGAPQRARWVRGPQY